MNRDSRAARVDKSRTYGVPYVITRRGGTGAALPAYASLTGGDLILIVDDHLDTGAVLARVLKKSGYEAVAVGSGRAALEMLATLRPSVMVLDVRMPEMDGLELLERVRADAGTRDVPVVVFSADYAFDTARRARERGAQEYIVKGTIGMENLCEIIGKYAAA